MMLIQNMALVIVELLLFIIMCVMFFIALALPVELIKQLKEMNKNGKNKS